MSLVGDYEEQFGKFIPDNENADWHARKEAAFDPLVTQRGEVGKFFTFMTLPLALM